LANDSCSRQNEISGGRDHVLLYEGMVSNLAMNKIMVAMSDDMVKALEQERKARKLDSIPETVRSVLGEYFKAKEAK
jgi:hypothetical protein